MLTQYVYRILIHEITVCRWDHNSFFRSFKGLSREVSTKGEAKVTVSKSRVAPLGEPTAERRFWFQRARAYDPDAIATLVRVSPIF